MNIHLFKLDRINNSSQVNGHHDQQMKHSDDDPSQLESLGHQEETSVDLHSMYNWQITASQQLETKEEWSKCIWDHQWQNECYIRTSYLKTNVFYARMLEKEWV